MSGSLGSWLGTGRFRRRRWWIGWRFWGVGREVEWVGLRDDGERVESVDRKKEGGSLTGYSFGFVCLSLVTFCLMYLFPILYLRSLWHCTSESVKP